MGVGATSATGYSAVSRRIPDNRPSSRSKLPPSGLSTASSMPAAASAVKSSGGLSNNPHRSLRCREHPTDRQGCRRFRNQQLHSTQWAALAHPHCHVGTARRQFLRLAVGSGGRCCRAPNVQHLSPKLTKRRAGDHVGFVTITLPGHSTPSQDPILCGGTSPRPCAEGGSAKLLEVR